MSQPAPRTFDSFPLDERLLSAVAALGYEEATLIQSAAIEVLLGGADVIARARTGSGKTAAFGLPLLHRVAHADEDQRGVQALVLAPTRELALQVADALRDYGRELKRLRIATVYGGAPYGPQIQAIQRGAQVVVGTPGRVVDLVEREVLDLSTVRMFVLDEADEMLKMGFVDEVEMLLGRTPPERQVMLLSATMPPAIAAVARKHLRNPVEIRTETEALAVDHVDQRYVVAPTHKKTEALWRLLVGLEHEAVLVFARTRATCAAVADDLIGRGMQVEALHGDLNQAAREQVLGRFRRKQIDAVIATDIAARGLDVDHVSHVINYDQPDNRETYVHRVGRTGRAGRAGVAITFLPPADLRRIKLMERTLGVSIAHMDVPSDAVIAGFKRQQLRDQLIEVVDGSEGARAVVDQLRDEMGWSDRQIAVAAVRLLSGRQDGQSDAEPDDRPPQWSVPPQDRHTRRDDDRDMVDIFVAAGEYDGIRAGHLVGALAHQAEISGDRIGRITIVQRKSYISLPRSVAQEILGQMSTLEIRGVEVAIGPAQSRPGGPPQRGPGPDGPRHAVARRPDGPRKYAPRPPPAGRAPARRKGPGIGKRGH